MNRRSFITKLARAAAGFAILPAATTYARRWAAPPPVWYKVERIYVPHPAGTIAEYMASSEQPYLAGMVWSWQSLQTEAWKTYMECAAEAARRAA